MSPPASMLVVLLRLTNHVITEHDPDFAVTGLSIDGFEPGLLGRLGIESLDVVLELAHEEKDAHDGQRPHDKHREEESLVSGHVGKCRV